ncbi:response regulator receiver domain [Mucilaginibacter sp.]|uniref:response regulator receiver domain n=1 Tax=Mucilaginibacter sp. TaxID=1882438 RepID=UPI00283FA451|nr:response regulator receiver domain [Mucilaginibacter sp.]MDR3695505.1 response regulator receiver domain [Mucilaginibacter sp.]
MNSAFFESSKVTANDFLQSIVFIDDEAYADSKTDHNLNAAEISKVFAKKQKICSVYNPRNESDILDLIHISKKADIVVVDWKIELEPEIIAVDENDDDPNDDPRGAHTTRIIKAILLDPLTGLNSLKMIAVYTGETDLKGITAEIFKQLHDIPGIESSDYEVFSKSFKVIVVGKPSISAKHLPEFAARIKNYEELPDFILEEFTKLTSGLVSDFVLYSLSLIRSNIFRLVNLFNKDIDAAFLSHRLLLPEPDDSKEQLVELLSHSINALLNYSKAGDYISNDLIKTWIDSHEFTGVISLSGKNISIDKSFLNDWVSSGFEETFRAKWEALNNGDFPEGKFKSLHKTLYQDATKYFNLDGAYEVKDYEFSILTHQKSNIKLSGTSPKLTLGTIVKQNPEGLYFVCIQQKCDSVRLRSERRFLFLPLTAVQDGKFHFVISEKGSFIRLKIEDSSFSLKTAKFKPNEQGGFPIVKDENDHYHFTSIYGEEYVWLSDLKDAHAQRIANNYAAKLSRVGLDESEWLRRWAMAT